MYPISYVGQSEHLAVLQFFENVYALHEGRQTGCVSKVCRNVFVSVKLIYTIRLIMHVCFYTISITFGSLSVNINNLQKYHCLKMHILYTMKIYNSMRM